MVRLFSVLFHIYPIHGFSFNRFNSLHFRVLICKQPRRFSFSKHAHIHCDKNPNFDQNSNWRLPTLVKIQIFNGWSLKIQDLDNFTGLLRLSFKSEFWGWGLKLLRLSRGFHNDRSLLRLCWANKVE